jgi:hypothetical protein
MDGVLFSLCSGAEGRKEGCGERAAVMEEGQSGGRGGRRRGSETAPGDQHCSAAQQMGHSLSTIKSHWLVSGAMSIAHLAQAK